MVETTDYAWLSAVVYRRGEDNQLEATEAGWEEVTYISDRPGDATYPEGGADGFSAHFCIGWANLCPGL